MRGLLAALFTAFVMHAAAAAERWQTLPPTPPPVSGATTGYAEVNGIQTLLRQLSAAARRSCCCMAGSPIPTTGATRCRRWRPPYKVILVDSRGHGRSTRDARPFGYDLMADDVVALMDTLEIDKADIVGWSDGGIIGIDLAMRHPDRVTQRLRLCRQHR